LSILVEAFRQTCSFSVPADKVLSGLFEKNRGLGSRERRALAACFYLAVRRWTWLEAVATSMPMQSQPGAELSGATLRRMAVLAAFLADQSPLMGLSDSEQHWANDQAVNLKGLQPQDRYCLPNWIWDDWVSQLGERGAELLAAFLDQEAALDLRLNLASGRGRGPLLDELRLAGIIADPIAWLPEGLRCQGRPPVQSLDAFKRGWFEVQDAGSQLLARLCAPQRGQTVVDFCAGAGGKTLALGALMRNTGRIYALDTSSSRLARLKPRLARSGLSNVWAVGIQGLNDLRIKRLRGKADLVLVDAPCTGLGTLRRNPDLKWRQSAAGLEDLVKLQASILQAASGLVRPGGRLVYATCSLSREENEGQVQAFLNGHPDFSIDPADRILSKQGLADPMNSAWFGPQGALRLWPHQSNTDGFFGAHFVRA
jgi:16S rRNA (cytosine967-C5)-methyltransferase